MTSVMSPLVLSQESQQEARQFVSPTLQPFALNYIERELTEAEMQTFVDTGSIAVQRAPRMMAVFDWIMISGYGLILVSMMLWIIPVATLARLRFGAKKGRCADCGYERRGLEGAVCPECGAGPDGAT